MKQQKRIANGSPVRVRYWPATVMRGACKSAVRQVGRRATAAVSKISLGTEICINMELDVSLPRKSAGIRDHCGRLRGIGNAEHMQTVRERTVCFCLHISVIPGNGYYIKSARCREPEKLAAPSRQQQKPAGCGRACFAV